MPRLRAIIALLVCFLVAGSGRANAFNSIDPDAMLLLQRMSETLTAAKSIIVLARVQERFELRGHRTATYSDAQAVIARPARLYAAMQSDGRDVSAWYDGRTFAVYDRASNVYTRTPSLLDDDDLLDLLVHRVGAVPMPLAAVLVSHPYAALSRQIYAAKTLGQAQIGETPCERLYFSGPQIDWELWVSLDDEHPLPARLAFVYKTRPGRPTVVVAFLSWYLDARLPLSKFRFLPPRAAAAREFKRF